MTLTGLLSDAPATSLAADKREGSIGLSLDGFLASVERRAYRMAQVATRDRDQALDLVQDAMIQFARRYSEKPTDQWTPLFYRCLQNRIRDWQRHQTVRKRIFFWADNCAEDDGAQFDAPDQAQPHGADQLQQGQAMHCLERALRKLPVRQKQAFELRIWEGLDVRDSALAMGCSEGSVKTHLSRALASLRAELEGVWP